MDDLAELARALAGERGERRPRTGPRSRLVDAIMVLLLSKPMRAAEIAGVFGLESKYVSSYLSYWRVRGYVDYDSGFWFLTPKGEEYAYSIVERAKRGSDDEYARLALSIASGQPVNRTRNNKSRGSGPRPRRASQSFIADETSGSDKKRLDRVSAVVCALETLKDLVDPDEFDVLNILLTHYSRWGSTYMYADQLQEALRADQAWLLKVLRGLQAKNLVYIYTDPRLGMRVGLSRRLKELLSDCS